MVYYYTVIAATFQCSFLFYKANLKQLILSDNLFVPSWCYFLLTFLAITKTYTIFLSKYTQFLYKRNIFATAVYGTHENSKASQSLLGKHVACCGKSSWDFEWFNLQNCTCCWSSFFPFPCALRACSMFACHKIESRFRERVNPSPHVAISHDPFAFIPSQERAEQQLRLVL